MAPLARTGSIRPAAQRRGVPAVALVFALAIFLVDAFANIYVAIAVLYVGVVLLSLSFCEKFGVLAIAAGCIALTGLALVIQHGFEPSEEATARFLVSLAAISITTLLAVRIASTTTALRNQAQLLDLTQDAIFVRDMNDIITYWNRGAEILYGWSSEEAMGSNSQLLTRSTLPVPDDDIKAQLSETGHWEGELVHVKQDGSRVTVASRWALQLDERGHPISILESNTDIEARKQAQEELAHAQSELAHFARISTLGELTASIAHEVNQPLAAIVTSGEACLRWLENGSTHIDRIKQGLERMIQNSRRASDVVRRLRALAKKDDLKKRMLDISELIEDTLPLVQHEVSRQRIFLGLDLAQDLPTICGDRVQLQQVIINLLINAIQAMSTVSHRRELTIKSALRADGRIIVTIRDNGHGFDVERQTHMFDAFFTTKDDGMGMGLSISRSIIDAHGGRIWASSNKDGGATFQFAIPTESEMVS